MHEYNTGIKLLTNFHFSSMGAFLSPFIKEINPVSPCRL